MSSGNAVTEFTRQEFATEAAILQASALMSNAVLRRALAIAAHEHVIDIAEHRNPSILATPDAGLSLMITWVMQACDEIEAEAKGRDWKQFPEVRA